jgi:plasmid maintenance system antidote protein VapI
MGVYYMQCLAEVITMSLKEGFKERFNSLKLEKNVNLQIIADAIHRNKATLSLVVNGKAKLTDDLLTELSNYFGVSKAYLLGESNFKITDEEFPQDLTEIMRYILTQNISVDDLREAITYLEKLRDKYQK